MSETYRLEVLLQACQRMGFALSFKLYRDGKFAVYVGRIEKSCCQPAELYDTEGEALTAGWRMFTEQTQELAGRKA